MYKSFSKSFSIALVAMVALATWSYAQQVAEVEQVEFDDYYGNDRHYNGNRGHSRGGNGNHVNLAGSVPSTQGDARQEATGKRKINQESTATTQQTSGSDGNIVQPKPQVTPTEQFDGPARYLSCRGTNSCSGDDSGQGFYSCGGAGSCSGQSAGYGMMSCSGIGSCTAQGSGRGRNSCSGTGSCTGVNSGRCAGSCNQTGSCTTANSCS